MTVALLLHEDGTVRLLDSFDRDPLILARSLIAENLDVVSAHHPSLEPRAWVLAVDDFGRTNERPLNRKGWALYGGSPIYGPALLYRDDHEPIPPELVASITDPDFPGADVRLVMDRWLDDNPECPR